jgi:hypothetical protein
VQLFHPDAVKFPQIKRAGELDDFSEGWPPLSESTTLKWRGIFIRISIYLTIFALVVSTLGLRDVLSEVPSSVIFPKWLLAKGWGQLLAGGVYLLLLEGWVAYCVCWGKRVPWVLAVFAWIGVYGMVWSASIEAHLISHAVFGSCGGFSDFVVCMAVGIACLITAVWLLEFRLPRDYARAGLKVISDFHMTRTTWRIFGLLAIALCWLGTLLFFDVL